MRSLGRPSVGVCPKAAVAQFCSAVAIPSGEMGPRRLQSMRWSRTKSTPDVTYPRPAAPPGAGRAFPGGGAGVGGGVGLVGLLVFLALQLLGGGGGTAFDVDQPFG